MWIFCFKKINERGLKKKDIYKQKYMYIDIHRRVSFFGGGEKGALSGSIGI